MLDYALLAGLGIPLQSGLPVVDAVLLQVSYHVDDFLAVQQTAHVTDGRVLADGVLQRVERVVEDALVVADVREGRLEDSSAEFGDGSEWRQTYWFLR